ncbi:hypothetical protein [Micromonospora chokoriensis]|uniref:hypothetical protein n=1 Tax=Micromonospora chokoriensis TaxID=356851 RepID=UPI000AB72C49|nr:hypothetical protein [Micromonospora chokoriensis]
MSVPGVADVIVEIGFTGPLTGTQLHLDDASRGLLDTGTLGDAGLWSDVSPWVASFSTRQGTTRVDGPVVRYEGGTASLVLRNEDRRFDPTNLGGPYVAAGVTQVEPMRAIRFRAAWGGVTYPLWEGFTDEWKVVYTGPETSEVHLTCVDAFAVFASYDRGASAPAGANEGSGARVNRILNSVGWPATDRLIDPGHSQMQATTLSDNALAELLLTADSELGELYIDSQGRVRFRQRRDLLTATRSNTPQAVFDDAGGGLPYHDVTVSYDRQSMYNRVSIARVGGSAQVVEDSASRDAYLTRTYSRTDLLVTTEAASLDYANWVLHQASKPELRFEAMVLLPQGDPDVLYPQALGRQLGDRVTVVRRPPGGGDPIDRDVLVRGIEHEVTPGEWRTQWVFQSASRLSFMVLDSPTLGVLDTNALGY